MQQTISAPISFNGTGLHNGKGVAMSLLPAPVSSGITFILNNTEIKASFDSVSNTSAKTEISAIDGTKLATIEHLMGALWLLGIDNLIIQIDQDELPAMDGSATAFFQKLKKFLIKQSQRRRLLYIKKEVFIENENSSYIRISPNTEDDRLAIDYSIEVDHPLIGKQSKTFLENSSNLEEIYSSRTYGFAKDLEKLNSLGLALGASIDNTIALTETDTLSGPLRRKDEFVCHKILDCLGDLALAPARLVAKVEAHNAGHTLHNKILRKLLSDKDLYSIV